MLMKYQVDTKASPSSMYRSSELCYPKWILITLAKGTMINVQASSDYSSHLINDLLVVEFYQGIHFCAHKLLF